MKKYVLVIISLLIFAGESMAQYATTQYSESLTMRMQKNAPALYRSYRSGSTLSGIGMGLMAGGLGAIVVGVATGEKNTTTNGMQTNIEVTGVGGAIAAVGTVALLTGTPLMIIGLTKKGKAKRAYLRQYESMGFERPASQGLSPHLEVHPNGLAFVF
jgi:hypothetical protein